MSDEQRLLQSSSHKLDNSQPPVDGNDVTGGLKQSCVDTSPIASVPFVKSFRKWIVIISTMSMTILFATLTSMSPALVCMIPVSYENSFAVDNHTMTAPNNSLSQSFDPDWHFNWSKDSQGWVLSSFFIGYMSTQVPSGIATTKWSAKRVLVVGLFLVSVLQVLVVPAAYYGVGYLYAVRVLAGVMNAFIYAPTFACARQWVPKHEVSMMFGLIGSGMELGNMLSFLISTFACEIDVQGGWPFIFYILAALGFLNTLLAVILVSDSPDTNRFISSQELKFISASVPKLAKKDKALAKIPVKSILKSMPVWAIVFAKMGSDWLYYFLIGLTPLYLKEVIKLSALETNFTSGMPFIFILPIIYVVGFVSDRLISKGIFSVTNMRKINCFFCQIIPGGAMLALSFVPEGASAWVFVLNTVTACFLAFAYVSWLTNPVDIAGGHTGFVVGVCQGAIMWVMAVIPLISEAVTIDKTREQWQTMFYVTSGLQIVTFIFYATFASGELQPWALSTYEYCPDDVETRTARALSVSQPGLKMGLGSFHESRTQESTDFTSGSKISEPDSMAITRSKSAVDTKLESSLTAHVKHRNATEIAGISRDSNIVDMDRSFTESGGKGEVTIRGKRDKADSENTPLIRK